VKTRVWVVDDSRVELRFLQQLLAAYYDVEAYNNGNALLERMASGSLPDVLVLDWHMPELSGLELCRFLRQAHDAASLPILILTASENQEDLLEGLRAGANDFLTKGANLAELVARVGTLVQVKSLHDALKCAELVARAARGDADAANHAKDVFLGIVSHELRTPLNSILGWSRLLEEAPADAKLQRQGLATIRRNAQLQVRLIEDILDTTRIGSGKLSLDLKSIDLGDLLRATVDGIGLSSRAKQQRLELIAPDRPFPMLGDPERLQQAISNVLANAVKFTPDHGEIRVELSEVEGHFQLDISDSGKGIEPSFLPHVFDRFMQQDPTASRRHSGLGLGLALVRHIVGAHGGEVLANSRGAERGSTFSLVLPPREAPSSADSGEDVQLTSLDRSTAALQTLALPGLRILVVEDDDDARELLVMVLERQGARVQAVANGQDALALIDEAVPEVLLSDIGLPGMDGHELVRRVRARGHSTHRLPAIAMTAFARPEDRAQALAAGFQAYISKPFDIAAVVDRVQRVLRAFRG